MEEERSSSLVSRIAFGLGSCLLVVVLYAASVGPVIFLLPTGGEYRLLNKFYQPLEWVAENTVLGPPLISYASWWRGLRDP